MKKEYWVIGVIALIAFAFFIFSIFFWSCFGCASPADLMTVENARSYGCGNLLENHCNKTTNEIKIEYFDANKDVRLNEKDTLFELCKNYYGVETEYGCKTKVCGCP